jgi:iron(III) transport system substrate-binding protein
VVEHDLPRRLEQQPRRRYLRGPPIRPLAAIPVLLAAAACWVAAAAGGSPPAITVYCGQHPGTIDALVKGFEQRTGIDVHVHLALDATLATQLVVEGSHSPADVFVAENSPALEDLQEHGLLAKVARATLARTPKADESPQGEWLGIAAHASLLVYNTEAVQPSELPKSILGLADPRWQGKLALAPSETDFQPIVVAVAAKLGKAKALQWLNGLKANAIGHVYSNNTAIVSQVNQGQGDIAVIDPYYWYELRDQFGADATHSAVQLFQPGDPGYMVDVSGAGILRSSKHQGEAQQFLAYMVSHAGQEALARGGTYEYPLVAGVKSDPALTPWAKLQPDPVTPSTLGDGQVAVTLLQQAGLL